MFCRIHLWSHLVLEFCLLGVFFLKIITTDSISLLVIGLHIIYFFLIQSLEIVGIYSFLLGCPSYWHIIVHSNLLRSFHFCGVGCNFSLSFPTLCIWALFSFWGMSLAKCLSVSFMFSKPSCIHWSFLLFFILSLFLLWSLWFISFC